MTENRFVELMHIKGERDFDAFLEQSGAAMQCTACRLDLEVLFMENFDSVSTGEHLVGEASVAPRESLKSRILRLIDSISPAICRPLSDVSPILRGNQLESFILVANDALLYDDAAATLPLQVKLDIRDKDGKQRRLENMSVPAGEQLMYRVSDALDKPIDKEPTIGSVRVHRKWPAATTRGTTRPQILLDGASGRGAVHTQGPNSPGTMWFSTQGRHSDERCLVTVVSAEQHSEIEATVQSRDDHDNDHTQSAVIDAGGAHVFEIPLPTTSEAATNVTTIRIDVTGIHKAHIISADHALSRLSIDHPSES